nr:MAG: major capsid protein [Microvirus sp.]
MKRSKFNLSHTKLFTSDMGELVPCGLLEVLPGDTIQSATTAMVRFAPMLAPPMHPTHCQLAHWFVPHRLVWDDFEDFITGGPAGTDVSAYPTVTMPGSGGAVVGSLADYLGVPTGVNSLVVSALPFRGYDLIWNEWYRDQDLQTELVIDTTSGPDTTTSTALQRAAWEKDYFTTARPWEQKGPAITIPLGTSAPVTGIGANLALSGAASQNVRDVTGGSVNYPFATVLSGANNAFMKVTAASAGTPQIFADLSGASAITISRLREAFALQRFEEARARYGSRYVEYLRYLGVKSSDARLQRPEFLGGGRYPVQYSEVLTTVDGDDPAGTLKGHGIGVARSDRYRRYFEEHGYVFSFFVVKPKSIYIDGLPRTWNRRTREDFFQTELQHIGQQEILNKEVYANHATPDGTFGFGDRYDEYRRSYSTIAGEFRTSLNFWHFARSFSSDPALNSSFITCVPPETPFAAPVTDALQVMAKHSIQARRIVSGNTTSYIY